MRHCEPSESGPIRQDLEGRIRHCERSAAVHAVRSHGLLHFVRNDGDEARNDGDEAGNDGDEDRNDEDEVCNDA